MALGKTSVYEQNFKGADDKEDVKWALANVLDVHWFTGEARPITAK